MKLESSLPELTFSYWQFYVSDIEDQYPRLLPPSNNHVEQGFYRLESKVSFVTLMYYGIAQLFCHLGPYKPDVRYQRVVSVPFHVSSGRVIIDEPEDGDPKRVLSISVGDYLLTCAQAAVGENEEIINLFFEKLDQPAKKSQVVKADPQLKVPETLLETADTA